MVDYVGIADIQRLVNQIGPGEFMERLAAQIEADSDRDRWFTAQEAKDYGFIDKVISGAKQVPAGAGRPLDAALGEGAQPDLGALQVGEDGDGVTGAVGGLADHPVVLLVVGVRPVAEVEPGDVHPGLDEGGDLLLGTGRRPEGADDLGATRHGGTLVGPSAARGEGSL